MTVSVVELKVEKDEIEKEVPEVLGDIWGKIRLWEKESGKPSDVWVILGEHAPAASVKLGTLQVADRTAVDAELATYIKDLARYGVSKGRRFRVDIKVPKALIERYRT